MDIAFRLYRIKGAEHIDHIEELEKELEIASEYYVDLHDFYQIDKIVTNKVDFDKEVEKSIPFKFIYGNLEVQQVGKHYINGYLPSTEIKSIVDWIKELRINTLEGFYLMYDNLPDDVKDLLRNQSAILSPEVIYYLYIKPMTEFYFDALKNNNSVILSGNRIEDNDRFYYEALGLYIDPAAFVYSRISADTKKLLGYDNVVHLLNFKKEIDIKMYLDGSCMTDMELIYY